MHFFRRIKKPVVLLCLSFFCVAFFQNCGKTPRDPASTSPSTTNFSKSNKLETLQNGQEPLWYDFLVQDVCLNEFDQVTNESPTSCSKKRSLRPGESVPYFRTDFRTKSPRQPGYQFHATIPIESPLSESGVEVVNVRMFERPDMGRTDFSKMIFEYNVKSGDGFDRIETNGAWMSATETFDGQCDHQRFSTPSSSKGPFLPEDSWPFFSKDIFAKKFERTQNLMRNTSAKCGVRESTALTQVQYHEAFNFESGFVAPAIESYHFASVNLAQKQNALERFYFTRELGLTRWESWHPEEYCRKTLHPENPEWLCAPESPKFILNGRCDSNIRPRVGNFGGQKWVMTDCRDWTNIFPLEKPLAPMVSSIPEFKILENDNSKISTNTYSYQQLSFNGGYVDDFGNGLPGRAITTTSGLRAGDIFQYGPYVNLPAGNYRVGYELLLDVSGAGSEIVAELEVTQDFGQKVLASRKVSRSEFLKAFRYQKISFTFSLTASANAVEFRTRFGGNSYLRIQKITLIPL